MPYFDEAHYIAQKVAQMNATGYTGRTGTAGQTWTAESAAAELAAWGVTWQENFNACNGANYATSITAADINVSGTPLFNVSEYAQALADYNNANSVGGQTNWTADSALQDVLTSGHASLWNHYTTTGAKLGLNPSNQFDTKAWVDAQAASTGQTADAILDSLARAGNNPVTAYLDGGGSVDAAPAVAADAAVTVAEGFNPWSTPGGDTPSKPDVPGQPVYTNTIYLTPELDVIPKDGQDMSGNDHIIGQEFDGVNTLQSGDRIDGGAGQDLLTADVTAGNTFGQILNTVRPEVHNVETIKFTSQQSTDTAHGTPAVAGIRADRIDGMTQVWSTDSRSTLHIDDIRIASNKMLVGWQNADNALDAGNSMDYIVRFNNQYLAADDATTQSTLQLQVMDVVGAAQGEPLLDNTYDGVSFVYNGTTVTLDLKPYQEMVSGSSANYQTLLTAIQNALDNNPECEGLTAALGPTFEYQPKDGTPIFYQGTSIVISAADGTLAPGRWLASNGVPADSDLDTDMLQQQAVTCPLLQTDIALDNVGMVNWFDPTLCIPNNQQFGDYAGDMIVGGMGEGGDNLLNYVGLQRFDVTVDRGSWLSSLQSTNHALRMITVKNGDLDDADTVVGTSNADKGNLFIGDGQRLTQDSIAGGTLMFEGRDGLLQDAELVAALQTRANPSQEYVGQTVESGVVDVAVFDASEMTGKANISAYISDLASRKYLGDTDQVDALGNRFAPGQTFNYSFGSNDDSLNMKMNGNVAADNDFKMTINMGDGNNSVQTHFESTAQNTTDDAPSNLWISDQWQLNNTTIITGSGNDIINPWGSGRVNVLAGAGNDVVYSDNSGLELVRDNIGNLAPDSAQVNGVGAIWVLNSGTTTPRVEVNQMGEIVPYRNDIISNMVTTYKGDAFLLTDGRTATLEVTVSYQGIKGTATLQLNMQNIDQEGGTGEFSVNSHQLNNLIMQAVNRDDLPYAKLHTLLSAQEGAGNSLMLISKIDGVQDADAVSISYKLTQGSVNQNNLADQLMGGSDAINDGYTALAQAYLSDGSTIVEGGKSTAYANNIINLGPGSDIAILSSSEHAHETIVLNDGNNGAIQVVRFDVDGSTYGQDMLDVSNILGGNTNKGVQVGDYTAVESGLESGNDTTPIVRQISFIENAAKDSKDYIGSAADLLAAINENTDDNPKNNHTLFMVFDTNADATYTMYKAVFDANGNCNNVSAQGTISFYNDQLGTDVTSGYTFATDAQTANLGCGEGAAGIDWDFPTA